MSALGDVGRSDGGTTTGEGGAPAFASNGVDGDAAGGFCREGGTGGAAINGGVEGVGGIGGCVVGGRGVEAGGVGFTGIGGTGGFCKEGGAGVDVGGTGGTGGASGFCEESVGRAGGVDAGDCDGICVIGVGCGFGGGALLPLSRNGCWRDISSIIEGCFDCGVFLLFIVVC